MPALQRQRAAHMGRQAHGHRRHLPQSPPRFFCGEDDPHSAADGRAIFAEGDDHRSGLESWHTGDAADSDWRALSFFAIRTSHIFRFRIRTPRAVNTARLTKITSKRIFRVSYSATSPSVDAGGSFVSPVAF